TGRPRNLIFGGGAKPAAKNQSKERQLHDSRLAGEEDLSYVLDAAPGTAPRPKHLLLKQACHA
ncbi:MAG: hypothetical protein RBT75_08475, partial [Anaerolineae bacterium]|nr:hypothetical protein [Anaerolineae bacterium]